MHTSKHLTTAIRRVNRKSSNSTRFTYANHTIYVVSYGRIGIGMNVWNGGNNDFFNGNIGEVLVYSKALTTAEIDVIENYINTKWNIYSTE